MWWNMDLQSIWSVVLPAYTTVFFTTALSKMFFQASDLSGQQDVTLTSYPLLFPPTVLSNRNKFNASDIHFCSLSFTVFLVLRIKKHRFPECSSASYFCSSPYIPAAIAMHKAFSNEQALLKNIRSEYQLMQSYCLTWEYPSAIWETIILSFGSLFLLYSSGGKHCQHVWISIEKGCCMKG